MMTKHVIYSQNCTSLTARHTHAEMTVIHFSFCERAQHSVTKQVDETVGRDKRLAVFRYHHKLYILIIWMAASYCLLLAIT